MRRTGMSRGRSGQGWPGAILLLVLWSGSAVVHAPAAGQAPEILNCGVSLSERLNVPGEAKRYAVEVQPGATVAVNASDTSGAIGLIKVRTSADDETCTGTLMLTQPGTAIVEVSDCFDTDTGPFTISASVVSETANCGRPLPCGGTLRVQPFEIAGEVDAYTFLGMPGDRVTVTAMDVSGTIGFVRLRIYDPDGLLISEADSCRSSNKIVTLEKAGMHTALASACGLPTTGLYGVALEATFCPTGPDITYLGIVGPDGTPIDPGAYDDIGRPAYQLENGAEFFVVIEGRPGSSGEPVGTQAFNWNPADPNVLPDLQVLVERPLGDGSPAVCDTAPPTPGGVPGTFPTEYTATQTVADAINDFGCRVDDGSGAAQAVTDAAAACTRPRDGLPAFVDPTTTAQFCAPIAAPWAFPGRGNLVKARLRDALGALGAEREMVVHVRAPQPCAGDCDDSGDVTIDELVLAVGIALGTSEIGQCEVVDGNGNRSVEVNELVQSMNNVLNECPAN